MPNLLTGISLRSLEKFPEGLKIVLEPVSFLVLAAARLAALFAKTETSRGNWKETCPEVKW